MRDPSHATSPRTRTAPSRGGAAAAGRAAGPTHRLGNRATLRLLGLAAKAPAGGDPGAPAPVQCKDGPAARPSPEQVGGIARAGVTGAGGPLPHRAALERALPGHDLGPIRAHTGARAASAARAIGAAAYAIGDRVAFTDSTPDLFTTAHETAHVLQQRAGVQLLGGVGRAGDPYEQNADDVAHAVVRGAEAPPILGGGGGGPAVQRLSAVGDFVTAQDAMMRRGRSKLPGPHTTVGFEFEFATMAEGNTLSGFSHVEVAESRTPMPDPPLPFYLETDASDALELVTPPFWLPTFGDQILPEPDAVEGVIDMFKARLSALAGRQYTISELTDELAQHDAIDLAIKDVELDRKNLTQRVPERMKVRNAGFSARRLGDIRLGPITKFAGGVDAQANIATDAYGSDLMGQAFQGDRFSDDQYTRPLAALEGRLAKVLFKHAFKISDDDVALFAAAGSKANTAFSTIDGALTYAHSDFVERRQNQDGLAKQAAEDIQDPLTNPVKDLSPGITTVRELGNPRVSKFTSDLIIGRLGAYKDAVDAYLTAEGPRVTPAYGTAANGLDGSVNRKLDRADDDMAAARAAVAETPHLTESPALRTFLSAFARALAGQISVTSIDYIRRAQEARWADPTAEMGVAGDNAFAASQMMSSRVKDVHGVWTKASVIDIGLGILSFHEWKRVQALLKDRTVKEALYRDVWDVAIKDVNARGIEFSYTLITADVARDLVREALRDIKRYIKANHLTEKSGIGAARQPTVSDAARKGMSVTPKKQPKFMTHDKALISPRQDTFVSPEQVTMSELWKHKTRQFVVESRTNAVDTLRRIKDYHAPPQHAAANAAPLTLAVSTPAAQPALDTAPESSIQIIDASTVEEEEAD